MLAGRHSAMPGSRASRSTRPSIRSWPISCIGCSTGSCPTDGTRICPTFPPEPKGLATRVSSGQVLNAVAKRVPWLMGGSADLAPSTKTRLTFEGAGDVSADNPGGRNLHFGIREHAMGAILNGMALVKVRAYGSGFLIFSDYARGAIRLSAHHGIAGHPHFHARLDRRGRRRSDPSAGRTARLVARDAWIDRDPSRRCQ